VNIGLLNDMVASSSKVGNPALEGDDEVDAKYISAPQTNLVKRIAFGEVCTTKASLLQSRIWLSHVCIFSSDLNINTEVVECRSKLKSKMQVLVGMKKSLCTDKCNAKLMDCS
jgi:hypothetical protein